MRALSRFFIFLLTGIGLSILVTASPFFSTPIYAAGEFTTSLESTYTVQFTGNTHVKQVFQLKNNFSTMYATDYALEVASPSITNVTAISNGTSLEVKTTPTTNKTSISFSFPDKVVGKDQIRTFTVEYDSHDVATKIGTVLEVSIPKLANPQEFSDYTVAVVTDSNFGSPTLAEPSAFVPSTDNGTSIATFHNVGQETGISVLYGTQQIATLQLTYHLENPKTTRGSIQVALPPDGTFQRIYYTSINPLPETVIQDPDGNWLATYMLDPSQQLDVQVTGTAVITLSPQPDANLLGKRPGKEYLVAQPYWPVNDTRIQQLAKQLKTSQAIFDYVVKTLHYDYARLEGENKRFGALAALDNPTQAVCLEFTDLFISIARAAGIPAREVNGYAYTQNGTLRPLSLVRDVLHAWPEYWDDQTGHWVAVDPTWANTTGGIDYFSRLDFNHIAFVTHGLSSEQPLAAGLYKYDGQDSKDVTITFGGQIPPTDVQIESSLNVPPAAVFGINAGPSLKIQNKTLHALYSVPYTIQTVNDDHAQIVKQGSLSLPPLSSTTFGLQLPTTNLLSSQNETLTAQIGSQEFTYHVNVQSTISRNLPVLALAGFVGICALIIAFISWRLLVPRRKRSSAVRRQSKESQEASHPVRPASGQPTTDRESPTGNTTDKDAKPHQ